MELEQNKATLKKAILALPSYQPPEGLWKDIEQHLEDEGTSSLEAFINKLPEYRPPAVVWDNISQALSAPETKARFKVRSAFFLTRAAAIVFIITASWLGYTLWNAANKASVRYSETTVLAEDIQIDFMEDEPMIRMVSQAFEESPVAQQQESYEQLLSELEELDQARQAILDMMDNYGEDPQMIKELADVERSRTDIVMKMTRFI